MIWELTRKAVALKATLDRVREALDTPQEQSVVDQAGEIMQELRGLRKCQRLKSSH